MRPFRLGLAVTSLGLLLVLGDAHGGYLGTWLEGAFAWLLGSTGVLVLGVFTASFATQYWHFMLTISIVTGIASSMIFSPCMAAVGHWFKERRGLALGIVGTGSVSAGIVLPQILLCGLFVPRTALPDVLRAVSDVLPLSYAVDAMQHLTRSAGTGEVWQDLAVVAAFALAGLALGAATLPRRTP